MDTTSCPECGALAEVEWRAVLESTDGPVEHAKVRCLQRHWFLLPVAALAAPTQPVEAGVGAGSGCGDASATEVRGQPLAGGDQQVPRRCLAGQIPWGPS